MLVEGCRTLPAESRATDVEAFMLHRSTLGSISIIVIVGGMLSFAPHAVAQDKVWRIGFLDPSVPPTVAAPSANLKAFRQGLDGLGYSEGRNYIIEARFADTDQSRLLALAKELVDRGVDVIVTVGTPTVRAAREATAVIPIIMAGSRDPVERGFIASLAHPGGNVTGVTASAGGDLAGKGLQLLKEGIPNISRVAILADTSGVSWGQFDTLMSDAESLKLTLLIHDVNGVKSATDYRLILSKIIEERADALFVGAEFVNVKYREMLLDFVSTNRLPSLTQEKWLVEHGLLLYYFVDYLELRRQAAVYVDKILKGTKPADLPVEQPTRFELIINTKTAEALGLTIPRSVLALADKVIE